MAYDESQFQNQPGFRQEPDFRADNGLPATYRPGGYDGTGAGIPAGRTDPDSTALNGVLDGPVDSDPGRDRLLVHFAWELVLLVGVGAVGLLLLTRHREQLRGDNLRELLVSGGTLMLLAVAAGLGLRAGAPNLAVGSTATASAIFFAGNGDLGLTKDAGLTVLIAAGVGAVIGLLVVGLHVPGWAASLGVALGLVAWIGQYHGSVTPTATRDLGPDAFYVVGATAALAVVGAMLGAARPIRVAVGRFRPQEDPAWRRGFTAGALALITLTLSGLLAGGAGVLLALRTDAVEPDNGIALTGLAVGAALLGGTSAFGRRGGVFGTVLAVVLLSLVQRYGEAVGNGFSPYLVAGAAIVLGLAVTRMVETFGSPLYDEDDEGDGFDTGGEPDDTTATLRPSGGQQVGWAGPLPVRTPDDIWGGAGKTPTQWGT